MPSSHPNTRPVKGVILTEIPGPLAGKTRSGFGLRANKCVPHKQMCASQKNVCLTNKCVPHKQMCASPNKCVPHKQMCASPNKCVPHKQMCASQTNVCLTHNMELQRKNKNQSVTSLTEQALPSPLQLRVIQSLSQSQRSTRCCVCVSCNINYCRLLQARRFAAYDLITTKPQFTSSCAVHRPIITL